jgi:hypothetical protein
MEIYTNMKKNLITTVAIDKTLYDSFKIDNIKKPFKLHELVNKCMYLYMNDPNFKTQVYSFVIPTLSVDAQQVTLNITGSTTENTTE